ncbi:MAG: ribonuclease III [Gammaproteobacteria bacterium]
MNKIARLAKQLGVDFYNHKLVEKALTHRSASSQNNERLEYLGDAVLGLIIAEALYEKYPEATEGDLTRYRARLVRKETLAEIALELDLGSSLRLGPGELKSGGYRRRSILADALEGVIGAIYLDQGLNAARDTVLRLYRDRIEKLAIERELKDPKTRLQELLQSRRSSLPQYIVVEVSGQPHEQKFTVECHLPDLGLSERSVGNSRRHAEQSAAELMLRKLEND